VWDIFSKDLLSCQENEENKSEIVLVLQGSCGSCWAFAATEMVESYAALATGELTVLSAQQVTIKV
jgi:C1A family cysteine protease